ncbi:hypothetical protein FVW20_14375 [Desulfovibrio oxamicus]|uniref:Antirepressor protein ant N-terminal domain-containing protein n=1 Tax=Nitratidesulfovibrio oxamicus TaxID=32016 RepID=A0ABS0J6V5_9BACT|nr:hypothetical protein [Nitratidesulfovibrio oxamicus]
MCEALGILWPSQRIKVMADPVLSQGVSMIDTPSTGGSQRTLMLPIEFLSGWLFTIKKVRPEVQDKLNAFRAEGFVARLPCRQYRVDHKLTSWPDTLCVRIGSFFDFLDMNRQTS